MREFYASIIKKYRFFAFLLSLSFSLAPNATLFSQTTSVPFITPGQTTWFCPAGVTTITVEAWGGGGAGGGITGKYSAAGGGSGGGYVKTTMNVVPGTNYSLKVGAGGNGTQGNGGNGQSSWFNSTSTLLAVGGNGAAGVSAYSSFGTGAASVTSGNIGGTLASYYGGKGANANSYNGGGGGGSSAGTSSNGNDASGTSGGAAPAGGGKGGDGSGNSANGQGGSNPGGAGAGANTNGNNNYSGGDGGNGKIIITYTLATTTTTTTSNIPSIVYGTTTTTFTATVSPNPGGGTVQFTVDGTINAGSANVNAGTGIATLNYNPSTLNAGSHSVVADFSGFGTYATSTASAVNFTVTQKPITVTGISAGSKVYDGTTTASFSGGTSAGIINGDVVTYTGAGTFDTKNVGVGKTVTLSGVTLGGADAANYSVASYPATVNANITPKPLTAASSVASKVYDANTTPGTVTLGAITGLVGSETLGITPSVTNYANANVGTGKATTISYSLADGAGGGLATNYSMADKLITNGVITARPITVTAATNTKVFDGNTSAAAPPTITSGSLVGTDAGNFTEVYNNKNAGTGKTLIPSGTVNDGNGGNNYTITFANNTSGVITAQPITVTASPNTKTYDASVTAAAAPVVTGTIFSGDSPSFTETYDNKNAGTGKTLTPVGVVTDGNGGNNYMVTFVPVNTGVIDKRPITVTAVTNTKPYDGNTSAAGIPTTGGGAIQAGDTPGFTETYETIDAGTGKTMIASGTVNDSNSGNNYDYTFVTNTTGVINPLVLTYVATPVNRAYGVANPALTGTVTGFLVGENISNATTGTLTFATTATISSPVGNYPMTGSGLTANHGNYTFVQAAANATAFTITKANLTITPDNQTKCAGSAFSFAGTEFTSTGLVNSDAITGVTLTSTGTSAGASPGAYPIVASGAVGNGLTNYTITYNNGSTLTVNSRPTAQITSVNTSICNPGTTNITGNVTAVGNWTLILSDGKIATGTNNGTFSIAVTPIVNTTYTVTSLTDANCSASTAGDLTGSTTVTVNQPVVITGQPEISQKVCGSTNSSVSFTVTATGDIGGYQWYKNDIGHPIAGATLSTYTIPNPVANDQANYFVVVKGLSPCSSVPSDNAVLTVNQAITISAISPSSSTLCEGDQATFSVTATGSISQYFWKHGNQTLSNGGNISGANTNSLTINPVSASDAGNYSLIINGTDDVCPQVVSAVDAVLNVSTKSANPVSATASSNEICNGTSTILTLNGGGGGTGEVIHWYSGSCGGTPVGTGNNLSVSPGSTTTYYGRYEDGSPCNYMSQCASVTVTVDPVSAGGTATMTNPQVCSGSAPANDITLSGNVGSIQWQKSTTAAFTSPIDIVGAVGTTLTASQIGTLTATTYFRAKVVSGVCNIAYSNVITITVNLLPTVNSVSPATSCGTDNITLSGTASSGATIDWFTTATGGTPVGSGLSYTTSITGTTTFYTEARNTMTGCISVGRTSVLATFKPKPDAQVSVPTQTICSENAITSVSITNPNNTTGTTFTWTRDNTTNVTGINNGSGTTISGSLTNTTNSQQTTIFTVTPATNSCTGDPVTATVIVNPMPTIAVTSAPDAVCYNSPIAIGFNSPNGVGTSFSWSRTSTNLGVIPAVNNVSGSSINETLVNSTSSNITVTYTLRTTSSDGCYSETTKDVILYAEFKSDNFLIGYGQVVCTSSTPDTLRIIQPVTGGSGNFSYKWFKSGSTSPVGTNSVYLPSNPNNGNTDSYSLAISDVEGCGNANSQSIDISSAFDYGLGSSGTPANAQLCNQNTFDHTISSQSIIGAFSGDINFSWKNPDGFITSTTDPYPNTYGQRVGYISILGIKFGGHFEGTATFKGNNTTNHTVNTNVYVTANTESYNIFGQSIGGCSLNTITVPVTIYPTPTMQQPAAPTICSGSPANVILKGNITDAPTSFSWTAALVSGNASGFSTMGAPGIANNIAAGSTFTIPDIITNNGTTAAVVHYTITPSSNGCNNGTPVYVDVTVNPTPTVSIHDPASVCSPGTVDLTAGAVTTGSTSGLSYTYWTDAAATAPLSSPAALTTSGTYYIKGTISSSGCFDIKPVNVVVNPAVPVSVSIVNTSSTTVCAGEDISFKATATNGGTSAGYQWQVNGVDVNGATGSTFTSATLADGDKVRVILTANPEPTCATGTPATSNEITVKVNPILPVSVAISATSSTTVCAGTAINFQATPTNPGTAPSYQWYVNGTAVTGANGATFSSASLKDGDVVTVGLNSNANPCAIGNPATSGIIQVTVNPILHVSVSIGADKAAICSGDAITFTATPVNGGTSPQYQWKVNGNNVGINSPIFTSSTLSDNDVVTCELNSNVSPCGQGSPANSNSITVDVKPDAVAGTITAPAGGTNLCVGGTSYTYVVTGNNAAGTWSNSDDNGVFSVDASGKVVAQQAGTAHLRYTVTTDCSTDYVEILLTVGATPSKPSNISGASQLCINSTGLVYSVVNDPELTYHWSVPAGWIFSGQGSNQITISSAVTTAGTVSVSATTTTYACAASPASTLAVTVTSPGQWLGTTSSDWNEPNNWGCATVPTSITDVTIPAVTSPDFYPLVQAAPVAMAHNITIASGASLTVSSQTLQISGSISNSAGTFDASNGTLEFNGTSPQTMDGSTFAQRTVKNLVVSNALSVANTANDNLNITGLISFGSASATLNTGNNITLKSTKDNTASIGTLGSGNSVSGQVEVERFINIGTATTNHAKTWQFLATPTQGQTLLQSWMENKTPGIVGYGAQFTGSAGKGFDNTSVAPSVKYWDEFKGGWTEIANATTQQLYNPRGYMAFIRGDRTVSGLAGNTIPNATTLRSKGSITTGNVSFTVPVVTANNTFFSIGNPYPSAVDMTKVITAINGSNELLPFIYVWNPSTPDYYYNVGYWNTYVLSGSQYVKIPGNIPVDGTIQSGQAFLVQEDNNYQRIVPFKETYKITASNNTNFRQQSVTGKAVQLITNLLALKADGSTSLTDGTLQQFDKSYTNKVEGNDARKVMNSVNNFSIKTSGVNLIVERRAPLTEQDTIQYHMANMTAQNYRLEFKAQGLSSEGLEGFVEDTYLKTRTPLNMEGSTDVDFAVTSDKATYAADRFRIVFKTVVVLPVKFLSVTAPQKEAGIEVKWQVENEHTVKQYTVEKSINGVNFKEADTVVAANNGAGSYQWLDVQVTSGYNYYRIKMTDQSGQVIYSTIVKVLIPFGKPSIGIYPNPITDGIIHLQFINQPKGRYGLRLLNPLGQTIIAKQVEHAGGNATENIKWDYNLAHGVYQLQVLKPDGKIEVIKVVY